MKEYALIIGAALAIIALTFLLGMALGYAGKIFKVKKDKNTEAIKEFLPGANCGGCGHTSCEAYAKAIATKDAPLDKCAVADEASIERIAEIVGKEPPRRKKIVAHIRCSGSLSNAKIKYNYKGLADCLSAVRIGNGPKECPYGCVGLGTCVKACPFGAISIVNDVALVDRNICMGCGACANACPRKLIELVPRNSEFVINCISANKGAEVKNYCSVGCMTCTLCIKKCPEGALREENNVVILDYDKCTACGICNDVCPRKTIKAVNGVISFTED